MIRCLEKTGCKKFDYFCGENCGNDTLSLHCTPTWFC